jgi:hypothetical protein
MMLPMAHIKCKVDVFASALNGSSSCLGAVAVLVYVCTALRTYAIGVYKYSLHAHTR